MNEDAAKMLDSFLSAEKEITCGIGSEKKYNEIHGARFDGILSLCKRYAPDSSARVLDIGRSRLSERLLRFYPNLQTLGFDLQSDDGGHRESNDMTLVPHIAFNLLDSSRVSSWPNCGSFDLIVFSEVLEHIAIAPEYVLAMLASLLSDSGILICTTPNAAAFKKRIMLALGRNPYERLRFYALNPGHVREYTRNELKCIVSRVGLKWINHSYADWVLPVSGDPPGKFLLIRALGLYPPFRRFQACVLGKRKS